jgi:DNA-directed RNA polymerase subunit RPC12/RpoP
MTELLENALTSIQLGVEDYQSNDPRRPVSAVRNFYAGVLLLGKHCLLAAAPEADPMQVLATRYKPVPDNDGGVEFEPKGQATIDLQELKDRFSDFDIPWPSGDIKKLQKLRNNLEHYHSPAPKEEMREAIAQCFPLVEGFCRYVEITPSDALGDAWQVMLAAESFFKQQKQECDDSLANLPWFNQLDRTEQFECPQCGSSLLYQEDRDNDDPAEANGGCYVCGVKLDAPSLVGAIVAGEFGVNEYRAAKEGEPPAIKSCPSCFEGTYVDVGDYVGCFLCQYTVEGECQRCGTELDADIMSVDNPDLCDYCAHMMSKDD